MRSKRELNEDHKAHVNVNWRRSTRFQLYKKNYGQLRKLKGKELVLPREEHIHCLPQTKRLALKTYKQVTLYKWNRLHLEVHNAHICLATTNEKKIGHEFEKEQGCVYERVWREER